MPAAICSIEQYLNQAEFSTSFFIFYDWAESKDTERKLGLKRGRRTGFPIAALPRF
jgi:hypothetical protein